MKRLIRGLTLCLGILSISAGLCADRYVVASGGTDSGEGGIDAPWATVTYAVTNSLTSDGDVIHIGAGNFNPSPWHYNAKKEKVYDSLAITKNITIVGEGDTTILTPSANVTFNAADLVVSGLKLTKSQGNWVGYTLTSGTVTNCLITGCTPQSTTVLTAISVTGGLLVDCRVADNTACNGNTGYGAIAQASGSATIRNCLFTGNKFEMNGESPTSYGAGALYLCPGSGKTVTVENTTVVGNYGGCAGGVQIGAPSSALSGAVVLKGCVFANNKSPFDHALRGVAAACSKDLYVNIGKTGSLTVENSHFGTMPASLATVATLTGVSTGAAGFVDEQNGDYTLNTGAPAYTFGYHAGTRASGFTCAVKTPATDRAIATLTATLTALTFDAPTGTASYEWDFDGDGTYDETTDMPTVEHTFTTVGWHKVGLKVTIGGDSATAVAENVVYIAPSVIYVYPYKKNTTGYNVFPYDTPYNAATTLGTAQKAAVAGSRIYVGGDVSGGTSLYDVEVCGGGKTSGSAVAGILFLYDGAFVHGLKLYGQRATPGIRMAGDTSCISNCWVTGMYYTTGGESAGVISAGLVTHTLYTGNYNNNSGGTVFSLCGTGRMRNCVFTGNVIKENYRGPLNGIMTVSGSAHMENCVVYGNTCTASARGDSYAATDRPRLSGGVYIPSGSPTIRNCVIRNNLKPHTPSDGKYPTATTEDIYTAAEEGNFYIASGATPTIENCNVPENQVPACATNCQTDNPDFEDPDNATAASRDFHIKSADSCVVDAGAFVDFATAKSGTDYYGNNRIQGYKADIGVHEVTKETPMMSVSSSASTYYDEQDVVFTASSTNAAATFPSETVYNWTVNGEAQAETGASLTLHVEPVADYAVTATVNGYFSDTKTIQVKHSPGVEFTSEATAKAGHALVNLSAYGVGGFVFDSAAVFKWYRGLHGEELGAEPFATGKDVASARFEVGTWDVKVVVENADGQGMQLVKLHEEELTVAAADVEVSFSATEGEQMLPVTMTAAATGFTFDAAAEYVWYWTNDGSGAADATTNPASHTFEPGTYSVVFKVTNADGAGATFTKTFPNAIKVATGANWYVSPTGDDAQGGSVLAPFASVEYALSQAADGQEIRLMAGTHTLTNALALGRNVKVVGAGAAETTVIVSKDKSISVSHADAVFAGCTVNKTVNANYPAVSLSAGTVRGCDLTKCSPSSTVAGCVLTMTGGLFEDCRVFGNSVTVGCSLCEVVGNSTVRNCAFFGNSGTIAAGAPNKNNSGAAGLRVYPGSDETVRIENCTIADNVSGWTGGLLVSSHINANYPDNLGQNVAGTVVVENSVFCGNTTFEDVDAASSGKLSDDIGVYAAAGHVSFSNCHIGVKPSGLDQTVVFTDCTDGYDLTFADEANGDYSLPTGSPRYGIGYHAGTHAAGFTAAVQAETARANRVPFTTTLNALTFNAPAGTASYAWDFDGDSEYETVTDVPTVEHTFTTVGNNTVGLKVTVGNAVAVAPTETVVYVLPTVYVKASGSGTYPYDTEEKAAKTLTDALAAAHKGSRVNLKGTISIKGGSWYLHDVEFFGDGWNGSSYECGGNDDWKFYIGKNACVHSMKMFGSRTQSGNLNTMADSAVVSNVWSTGMWFTTRGSPAGYISKGLVTHSKFTGCHCNYGPVISIYGTATVRNCVFTDNRIDTGVAAIRTGIIHVYGNAVFENNTVWGNYASKTDSNEVHTAGLYIPSGSPTIRNNIVRYNWIKGTPGSAGAEKQNYLCLAAATPTVTHNNSDEGFGENATTGDPIFTNAANGDFSISTEGAAFEKGCAYPALKVAGATDYAGNARVQGWAVDQGAYEATTATPGLDFTASVTSGVGAQSVTLTLTSDVAMPAGTVVTWFWNGAEVAEKGASVTLDLNPGHHSFAVDVNGFFEVTKQDFVNLDPATVYVIPGNAGAVYPYDTRETAAATLDVAVSAAAASGTTIVLTEGEHTLAADLTVAKNVTIVGEGPGAKVTGTGALTLNAGHLQRVDFTGAGTLTVGTGATVRNAIVRNSTAATAVMVLAGGSLQNATVWGNAGVGVSNAGTAVNVVAWQNGTNLAGEGAFDHCLGTADPLFADPANGDFTFIFDSPCYNAGTDLDWAVADDAIDFYGHKRKLGPVVDIGAHEEENYVESVGIETEEQQMNGYKRVTLQAKARGFHFANTAEFQWFWTTPGTGAPDATGNNVAVDFGSGTYDLYLKVLEADSAGTDFATNAPAAIMVDPTSVSFNLSATMGGDAKTIALTAVPSGFTFTADTVYKWFWSGAATPDATVNPAVHTFTVGTYGVKLVVENANGHGLALTNEMADAIKIYDNTPPEVTTGAGGGPLYVDQLEAKAFKTVNGQSLTGHGTLDIVSATSYRAVEDVSAYGATGDGVTDDTAAIMAAYEAAVASGKPLYFPKRGDNATYLTRKGIVMVSGMTLTSDPGVTLASASAVLEGGGRTIRTTLAAEMPKGQTWCMVKSTAGLVVGQEVTIGDGASYTETLADITAIDAATGRIDFDVSRFRASGTNEGALNKTAAGSYFLTDFSLVKTIYEKAAVNVLVENITLKPYGNPSDPYIYTISPIHQTAQGRPSAQQYFRIRNVTIDGATHDGISLQGSGDSIVENCVVKDVKRKGIHWGTTCNRVIVRNNLCVNCGLEKDDASTSNWGVGAMYFCVLNHQMIIEGNHFKNCYRGVFGFDYRGSGESDGDSTVANNTFEGCTYGVFTYGGYRLNVVGNTFTGLDGKAMAVSVNKDNGDGLLSSVISGNTVGGIADTWTGKAFGIDCCTGLVLEGNVVTKNPNATGFAGVKFKNAKKSVVADNVLPDGVDDSDETNTGIIKSGNIISEEVQ